MINYHRRLKTENGGDVSTTTIQDPWNLLITGKEENMQEPTQQNQINPI
jgi:hypothetical protein